MTVVLLSGDLMAVSRAQGAASHSGVELRSATSAQNAVACCNDEQVKLVVVDLASPALDIDQMVSSLKARGGAVPKIVAFGPHVHEERLAAARQAGCDEVLSRGQFFAQIEAILRRHALE